MDNRHDNTSSSFDIIRVTKSDIVKIITSENIDTYNDIEHLDVTTTEEFMEANFCLLPPYCLIEDKEKYLNKAG